MITRKELRTKLEDMNRSEILVSQKDQRNSHHMASATPLQKVLAQLVGTQSIEARTYTTKHGVTHSSPAWLIEAYKKLVVLVSLGADINVRMVLSSLK